ncbi:MAG TPA: CPBP family glutamic-type intramembrane protease [Actinomycetota bacterium]|nr:CPBP family glutamic-type intramembrane protease [Actinomycetota bacterium]
MSAVATSATDIRPALVAAGLLLLVARRPVPGAVAMTVAAGSLAVASRGQRARRVRPLHAGLVTALGIVAFAASRLFGRATPLPAPPLTIAADVVAAVAEEAFFRHLMFQVLQPFGPVVAVAGTAAAFAAIHIPMYGLRSVPLNFAAGLLFGWQRHATGTWTSPAASHVIANLLSR